MVLHVYDLSMGMAASLSQALIGRQLDGLWHTGVYVHGYEYFYGGGIQKLTPASVTQQFGLSPVRREQLGSTTKTASELHAFLRTIEEKYNQGTYSLFHNNCNNFSDDVAKFLLGGVGIPADIIELPAQVLSTPMGQALAPMYQSMQQRMHDNITPLMGGNNYDDGAGAVASVERSATTDGAGTMISVTVQVTGGGDQEEGSKTMSVPKSASVGDFKTKLAEHTGYAVEDQRVVFRGQVLSDDSKTIDTYGITDGQAVHLMPKQGAVKRTGAATAAAAAGAEVGADEGISVTVQVTAGEMANQKLVLRVKETATVADLKDVLTTKTGYTRVQQRVIFRGQVLSDDTKPISSYGVTDGQSVHLVPKPGATSSAAAPAAVSVPTPAPPVAAATGGMPTNPFAALLGGGGIPGLNPNGNASAAAAAAAAQRWPALVQLRAQPNATQVGVCSTLIVVVTKIEENPNETKFRRLRKNNAAFARRIFNVPGALQLVLAMGFKEEQTTTEEGDTDIFYVLEPSAAAWEILMDGKQMLVEEKARLTAPTPSPVAAPAFGGMPGMGGMPPMPGMGGGGGGGMAGGMDMSMITGMLNNPAMMQMMMNSPMVRNNPQMQQQFQMIQQNPDMFRGILESPMGQQMLQQTMNNPEMVQQMMGGLGAQPGGQPGGGGVDLASMMAGFGSMGGGNNNTTNANNNANNNTNENGDTELSEEEMLEEAIRRSLQEQ